MAIITPYARNSRGPMSMALSGGLGMAEISWCVLVVGRGAPIIAQANGPANQERLDGDIILCNT
jgi:hypothetical protein